MYDTEIVQMLALIHNENHILFEMCKGIIGEDYQKIEWKPYEDTYNKIVESLHKYSNCN